MQLYTPQEVKAMTPEERENKRQDFIEAIEVYATKGTKVELEDYEDGLPDLPTE